jgi:hypothetical protein
MHFRMLPGGVVLVFGGFQVMTANAIPGMMRRLLVVARLMMLGGLTMMFGSVIIVLCCLFVMLMNLGLCHSVLPNLSWLKTIQPTRQIVYELIGRRAV